MSMPLFLYCLAMVLCSLLVISGCGGGSAGWGLDSEESFNALGAIVLVVLSIRGICMMSPLHYELIACESSDLRGAWRQTACLCGSCLDQPWKARSRLWAVQMWLSTLFFGLLKLCACSLLLIFPWLFFFLLFNFFLQQVQTLTVSWNFNLIQWFELAISILWQLKHSEKTHNESFISSIYSFCNVIWLKKCILFGPDGQMVTTANQSEVQLRFLMIFIYILLWPKILNKKS